jgi:hypothetical protein
MHIRAVRAVFEGIGEVAYAIVDTREEGLVTKKVDRGHEDR